MERLAPPKMMAGLEIYFKAYQDLLTERAVGMSIGLIPWYSIVRWCKHYSITKINDIENVIRYVRALETAANEWQKNRAENQKVKG